MIEKEKFYVGSVDNILKAAIIYDLISIQSKGEKAITNFNYSAKELIVIMQDTNISQIIQKS